MPTASNMLKISPYLRQKCNPENQVFENTRFMAIFAEITDNTCIIELLHIDNCCLSLILVAVSDSVKVSVAVNSQMFCIRLEIT